MLRSGAAQKGASGNISLVVGTGGLSSRRAHDLDFGCNCGTTGGAISVLSGHGTATSSGVFSIQTSSAGDNGVSGSLAFSSGSSSKGSSGMITSNGICDFRCWRKHQRRRSSWHDRVWRPSNDQCWRWWRRVDRFGLWHCDIKWCLQYPNAMLVKMEGVSGWMAPPCNSGRVQHLTVNPLNRSVLSLFAPATRSDGAGGDLHLDSGISTNGSSGDISVTVGGRLSLLELVGSFFGCNCWYNRRRNLHCYLVMALQHRVACSAFKRREPETMAFWIPRIFFWKFQQGKQRDDHTSNEFQVLEEASASPFKLARSRLAAE